MFGRTVTIDGEEIFVSCCPDTPLSEVLVRAAREMERREAVYLSESFKSFTRHLEEMVGNGPMPTTIERG